MWDRIAGDWHAFRHHARREWAHLTDAQLDEIDGRRDRLQRRVSDVYGVTEDEAGKQVDAWEAGLRRVEPAPSLDSDPTHYPPARDAQGTYSGTMAAAETRNESRDAGAEPRRSPRAPREDGGVFDNEGQEFGEHDRPGGEGMPGNQAGGRDPGPVEGAAPEHDAHATSGASAGARMPGNAGARGAPPPGTAGRGSG